MRIPLSQIVSAWLSPLDPQRARTSVSEMQKVADSLQDQVVRQFFLRPRLSASELLSVLSTAGLSKPTLNLLAWLHANRLITSVPKLASKGAAFIERRDDSLQAQVTSAVQLSEKQQSAIATQLREQFGANIMPEYAVDPRILGGLIVRAGSLRRDLSVRGKLMRIRQAIINT